MDLSQAYLQPPVNEESKHYLTINTHQGLYVYNRLPFGVALAPAVTWYTDDMLVSSADKDSHLPSLEEVFSTVCTAWFTGTSWEMGE